MNLNYEVHQPDGADSNSPTLVLIHGLFGNLDNLAVIRRFFQAHYRVVSIDLPDHGKSERSLSFSFEDYAQSVSNVLDKLNLTHVVLVGHSLGGKVSMLVARNNPERIAQLVILDIAPIAYPARHHSVMQALAAIDLLTLTSRKDAEEVFKHHLNDPGTRAFLLKSLYVDEEQQWHWRFNLELIIRDYDKLSAWPYEGVLYSGPTLFIKGADSDYIQSQHRPLITAQFPNATAKVIQAGHWLHAQKPQTINALLTKYLPVVAN